MFRTRGKMGSMELSGDRRAKNSSTRGRLDTRREKNNDYFNGWWIAKKCLFVLGRRDVTNTGTVNGVIVFGISRGILVTAKRPAKQFYIGKCFSTNTIVIITTP
jgi:hypothetical protein